MLNVDTAPVRALRDRLLRLGRPSQFPPDPGAKPEGRSSFSPEQVATLERVRPFAELMFLVMVADRCCTEDERTALRGAFRALTGGRFRSRVLDDMLEGFEHSLRGDGWEARLEEICSELALDRQDAEAAFSLAAAMSLADGALSDGERELLDRLSSWLRLGKEHGRALLSEVDSAH